MISVVGPGTVRGGAGGLSFCVSVIGVSGALSVYADLDGQRIRPRLPPAGTAHNGWVSMCFTLPPGSSGSLNIVVADQSGARSRSSISVLP
ncbi:MAG: hypothetical protein KDB53_14690 [Planctomycetes bacterium]|nr:hypothetical protein [Planctomycetota bacterium]